MYLLPSHVAIIGGITVSCVTITGNYFYNAHMRIIRELERDQEIKNKGIKLSGAYIVERAAFGNKYWNWVLPYHQSLLIEENGEIRHVGLGKKKGLTSWFVPHVGGHYDMFSKYEIKTPVEKWDDYYKKFGYYPENVDIQVLKQLTKTSEETSVAEEINELYQVTFGKPGFGPDGTFQLNSCRTALIWAVYSEQQSHQQVLNQE